MLKTLGSKAFSAAVCFLFMFSNLSLAGQYIDLTGSISYDVYGNGDEGTGAFPSGGVADLKDPNGNTVNITNVTTPSIGIYAAFFMESYVAAIQKDINVNNNTLTISNSIFNYVEAFGAYAAFIASGSAAFVGNISATRNAASINNSTFGDANVGGVIEFRISDSATFTGSMFATENVISIDNSTALNSAYAVAVTGVAGTVRNTAIFTGNVSAIGDAILINNSDFIGSVDATAVARFAAHDTAAFVGDVSTVRNVIAINDSTFDAELNAIVETGAEVNGSAALTGNIFAAGNIISINNSTVADAEIDISAYTAPNGSAATTGNISAVGNAISIANSTFDAAPRAFKLIVSARAVAIGGSASSAGNVSATGNVIQIADSAFNNNSSIVGGNAGAETDLGATFTGDLYATNNTVNISGNTIFAAGKDTIIYGGYAVRTGYNGTQFAADGTTNFIDDAFTGNTLNLRTKGLVVSGVQNFQNYNFYLPDNINNGEAMITATDGNGESIINASKSNGAIRLRDANIKVYTVNPLNIGDRYVLIKSSSYNFDGSPSDVTIAKNKLKIFEVGLSIDPVGSGEELAVAVTGVKVNPQSKALSEERVASIAFIGQGADLIADKAYASAAASLSSINSGRFAPFIAISGGKSRYKTGSHADISGVTLAAGLAKGFEIKNASITAGAFIEHGNGKYESLNAFNSSGVNDVFANGIMQYTGGGLFGKIDFRNNFYVEASGRAGGAGSNFNSDSIIDATTGLNANYDYESMYFGAHIGGGYNYKINDKFGLNGSAKYFYAQQAGKDISTAMGEKVKFAGINSQRVKIGAKLEYVAAEKITPYIGGAFEYELAGKADAKIEGLSVDAPSIEGASGIGEIGVSGSIGKFIIDIGAKGYAGARQGVEGMLKAKLTI
ncbi:beta strand repeat-containing protein [Endomicrobium proavitum]|nr:autotransporter outer membrane beta-barrel domain-containing protein [Endomicrobium proavitum]